MNYLHYFPFALRTIAILSAIIACGLYFLLEGKLQEKDQSLKQIRMELGALKDENESANLEIASLQEQLAEEKQLTEASGIAVEEAEAQLAAERQESQRLQDKLNETVAKTNQLEETANRLRRELVSTENSFASNSQESVIAQLSERVEELTQANIELEDKIKALPNSSSFASETENPAPAEQATLASKTADPAPTEPATLTADEVEAIEEETKIASISAANGIIVLDADPDLNLKSGMQISLIKNAKVAAKVKIININGTLAIANILPGANMDSLSKGEIVKILR